MPRISTFHRTLESPHAVEPAMLMVTSALTLLLTFATMSFGLFSFLSLHFRRSPVQITPLSKNDPSAQSIVENPEQKLENLERQLTDLRERAREIANAEQQTRARLSALAGEEPDLEQKIEQRRSDLRQAQTASRRAMEEQKRAAEELARLRAEAAELERRISALRASLEDARRAAAAVASTQNLKPQVVECVQGAIILQPQHVRIALSNIASSQLVTVARQRGVYFVVHPSGFASFIAARDTARAVGVVVGYEPAESNQDH